MYCAAPYEIKRPRKSAQLVESLAQRVITHEVGGDADALEDHGEGGEFGDGGVREGVGAGGGGVGADGLAEEVDVLELVRVDLRVAVADPGRVAGLGEGVRVELGQRARVERLLEVLEGQRVLEDVEVC